MINLIVTPKTNLENIPDRLILPFNNEEDIRLAIQTLLDITNAGVTFTTQIAEDVMEQECEL